LLAVSLFLGLSGLTWLLYRRYFRDGIGPTGQWDDEGGTTEQPHTVAGSELNYEQSPIIMSHFNIGEFDSSDQLGSGVPFRVNSGYRTPEHNAAVGGVPDSAHTRGWAADIAARTLEQKIRIVRAARSVGFNRFGIYDTFVHLDCDPGKQEDVAWNGKGYAVRKGGDFSSFPFDPFTV
ncbi:MAG: D-Ala-D-Ala carboxypeptidase family metallohydrolase, partial [Thermoanaerobaculia bacterium]|nr:D-Ala-D-Ala carboxypeptidase family metallohydrolase [Thermoanaerobaculia bacterium]